MRRKVREAKWAPAPTYRDAFSQPNRKQRRVMVEKTRRRRAPISRLTIYR